GESGAKEGIKAELQIGGADGMQQQIVDALPDWNIEVRTCGQAYRRAGSFRKQIKLESERRQADSRAFRDKSSKRQKIVVSGGARERLSSAINRSELVSEYRRIMLESSQAGIRDVDHPELKPTQCSSLLECDVVRVEARPWADSDLVCPVRGWNEVVPDCNGWSRI